MISGKRTLKNVAGQVDSKVENYRTSLVQLREKFLAYATVTTEAAVFQIRDQALEAGA